MLYKPNFCCSCGEKIERVDWNILTSRRFCDVCSIENRRFDLVPRVAVAAGSLALMFGFGSLWSRSRGGPEALIAVPAARKVDQTRPETTFGLEPPPRAELSPQAEPSEIIRIEPKRSEAKFFCGALTKKGTPCSRKVKTRGTRCYQHEGRPEAPPIN